MTTDDVANILAAAESFVGPAPDDRALADHPRSDLGNARRLIARRGHDMLWVEGSGWHVWNGTRWAVDAEDAAALRLAHDIADAIEAEAAALREDADEELGNNAPLLGQPAKQTDPDPVTAWRKRIAAHRGWAVTSGNQARAVAMLEAARPYLSRRADEMDAAPDLLCVTNGTLELRADASVTHRAHDRSDLITRTAAVPHDPNADCPNFRAFIDRVLPKHERALFLQMFLGYCLTGQTSEQVMAILTGGGANGKSTLLNCVAGVLGGLAMAGPVESFLYQDRNGGERPSPDMARLPGARLVMVSEPEIGARLSESRVKGVTGGERVIARKLHRDFFEFDPQFKLALSCNVKPTIRGSDDGIWRRILIIPFDVQIPPGERIKDFHKHLLAEEAAGILNWLLDGWRLWIEHGLALPEDIRAAVNEYRQDSDPVGEFLATETEESPVGVIRAAELYEAYVAWAREAATSPVSQTLFGRRLNDRGVHKAKRSDGTYYVGRMLRPCAMKRRRTSAYMDANDVPPPAGPEDYGT